MGRLDQQCHHISSNGKDIIPIKGARVFVVEERMRTLQGKKPSQSHQTSLFCIYQINFYFELHYHISRKLLFLGVSPCTSILLLFLVFCITKARILVCCLHRSFGESRNFCPHVIFLPALCHFQPGLCIWKH